MASRFLTKKSPSNQNLPYEMLNTGFPILYSRNINNCLAGFFLAFGNFAHYRVFLLNAPLSDRDAVDYFSREILIQSSLTPGGPVVLLVCGFRRRDNLLAWRELFVNLYELKSRIRFWEEYNHFERIYRVYRFDQFSSNFAKTFKE